MSQSAYEKHLESVFGGLNEARFKYLFFILVGIFFIVPLFSSVLLDFFPLVSKAIYLILFLIVLAGVTSVSSYNKRIYRLTVTLSLLAIFLHGLHLMFAYDGFLMGHHLLMTGILGYIIISLVRYLFMCRTVTLNTIYAALCSFILIALVYALLFSVVEILQPGAFSVPMDMDPAGFTSSMASDFVFHQLYFSMVTITTLGYGDIQPMTSAARMLASAEAFTGQMFIAIMIARLVGIYSSQSLGSK